MPRACDLKRGSFVKIKNLPYILEGLQVSNPSARGAATLYHFRFRNLIDKSKEDVTCKGEELFAEADFERRAVQYLYGNQGVYTFMDQETFEQFDLSESAIGDKLLYLLPDMENIQALFSDGQVMTIEVPQKIAFKIAECSPVMKGATATSRPKPAKMETGLVVMVPEYMEAGETIIVNTEDNSFVSRA